MPVLYISPKYAEKRRYIAGQEADARFDFSKSLL